MSDNLMSGSGIEWTDEQLKAAGISKRKLVSLIKKLKVCDEMMQEMGLEVYGNGCGHLIHESRPTHSKDGFRPKADLGSVIAMVGYRFNGGDW